MRCYRRPKETELKTIAKSLNAFQGTQEEVMLRLIRKSANTFRPTLDFGIENRALQHLVLSVLYAIAELHPPDNSQLVEVYPRPSPRSWTR
jgi:hypothetical protein